MRHLVTALLTLHTLFIYSQGVIEADSLKGSHIGDGSRLINLPNQNLQVSSTGDTLHITEGNFVIIPGLSASNSGNTFANAGPDIVNACETSFNLQASPLSAGTTGEWSIISGTGGVIINEMLPQALFAGQEGESYTLQWTVQLGGGSSAFDQVNVSIAVNTQTSVADAGNDLFAIMNQSVVLNGNAPELESDARWEIVEGSGGILSDINDPSASFTGVPGESYTLRWFHFNDCSTSTDEVNLTFSESAAGVPSPNGRYFIPDPKFRQYLQIAYPAVMDGDSLIIDMGDQVDKIRINNLNVSSLDGIQYLTAFEIFQADQNQNLTAIPYLSPDTYYFSCYNCSLNILAEFPESLDTIRGRNWKMSAIPSLPISLKYLYLEGFQNLTSLVLPSMLKHLELRALYDLQSLSTIPETCEYIFLELLGDDCCPGDLMDTINIPSSAKEFYAYFLGIDVFPKLPVVKSNLERLALEYNNISQMPSLYAFTNLTEIQLNNNAFFQIDSLPFVLQQVALQENPIICVKNKPPLVASQMSEYEICPN